MNPNIKLCLSFPHFAQKGANPSQPTPLGLPRLSIVQLYSCFPRKIFGPDKTLVCACVFVGIYLATKVFYRQFAGYRKEVGRHKVGQ